jgi:hypothetical protein
MPSYDNKVLTGDQLVYYSGLIKTALASKQNTLTIGGSGITYNASTNPVATLEDIPLGVDSYLTENPLNAGGVIYDDSDENNVIWLADKVAELDT